MNKKLIMENSENSGFGVSSGALVASPVRTAQVVVDQVKNCVGNLICSLDSPLAKTADSSPCNTPVKSPLQKAIKRAQQRSSTVSAEPVNKQQHTHEEYLRRLKTFTLSNWFGKPMCLSPPFLAQFGWECMEEDVVTCVTCGAMFSVRLPLVSADNYENEVRKACSNFKDAHSKMCAWPHTHTLAAHMNPFDDLVVFGGEGGQKLVEAFASRVSALKELGTVLPHVSDEVLTELNLKKETLMKIYEGLRASDIKNLHLNAVVGIDEVSISAIVLALCGWTNKSSDMISLMWCKETNCQVGLWNFYSVAEHKQGVSCCNSPDKQPSSKRCKTRSQDVFENELKSSFHPLDNNYRWSPWSIVLHSDASPAFFAEPLVRAVEYGKKAGWQVLLDLAIKFASVDDEDSAAKTAADDGDSPCKNGVGRSSSNLKSSSRIALKQAVNLLDNWTSPSPSACLKLDS